MKPYLITNSDRPGWVGKPPPVNVLCVPPEEWAAHLIKVNEQKAK